MPKNNPWTHSPQQSCVDNSCLFQSINSHKVAETIIVLRLTFLLKRVFPVWNRKSEHRHWILHIWIRLGTKFQLKLTVFIFWIKFAQKGFFPSKTEKVNTTIEFCLYELVYAPNFNLNWQFCFLGPNLTKKGCFWSKTEKVNTTIELYIFELVSVPNFSFN